MDNDRVRGFEIIGYCHEEKTAMKAKEYIDEQRDTFRLRDKK